MYRRFLLTYCLLTICILSEAQKHPRPLFLWRDVPAMKGERTRLYVYNDIPDSLRTGVCAIVCPGGSYHHLGMKHEGYAVAKYLNTKGISAFVLRYRVGSNGYHYPAMIEDLQRAIQYVTDNGQRLKIDTNKIGVIGFSAGGHLVTMAGAMHSYNFLKQYDIHTSANLRPNFVVAVYPVVSMQDNIAHKRSRRNLLGNRPLQKMIDSLSLEHHIPPDMPPTLIVASHDDPVVNPRNSTALDSALNAQKITHKFLLYQTGGHGFGLGKDQQSEISNWKNKLITWLSYINVL